MLSEQHRTGVCGNAGPVSLPSVLYDQYGEEDRIVNKGFVTDCVLGNG